jgi:FkbM family methyltransferase
MLTFYYGILGSYANITKNVFKQCFNEGWIIIPPDDNKRANLFGDPMFGVRKHIKVVDLENNTQTFSSEEEVRIKTDSYPLEIYLNYSQRKEWWKEYGSKIKDPNERLIELQNRIELIHGDFVEEFPEQLMIIKYLEPSDKVLEIGSNIGRSSCIIASILEEDKNFVTMECHPQIFEKVKNNRDRNGFHFHIEPSALSKRSMIQKGIFTYVYDEPPQGYFKVPTILWQDFKIKYPIDFTVLVADCEGSLYHIIKDEENFLDGFKKIITENDYRTIEEYEFVRDQLVKRGFRNVFTQEGGWGCCYSFFYQVWMI